uniref:Pco112591 n=1 Tax=Arundo donax TaxID=35708 RepID=A0A0A9EM76_ARUDO
MTRRPWMLLLSRLSRLSQT